MPEQFQRIRDWLAAGAESSDAPDVLSAHACCRRLVRAICNGRVDGRLGSADIVTLTAHVLRREQTKGEGRIPVLRVPAPGSSSGRVRWPELNDWTSASLGTRVEAGSLRLTPRRWEPTWLTNGTGDELSKPVFAEEYRRTYEEVSGDPFLRVIAQSRYRCDAQREAVRAVLSVPDGATLVVNLPTGAGKSICAYLPALMASDHGGVSIIVVPTTALALDQEKSVTPLISHPTAYVGGGTSSEEERRAGIRARIRDGSQRVVFSSPEGLLQGLRAAVYDAARRALIRFFVIDEAHMVDQWGDEFRSSFQELAGLRTDLQRHVPVKARAFTTLLLSATTTETVLDTLETLFAEPGPFDLISAAQLRPEPAYWTVPARDGEAQAIIVMDALAHLPRPLILYVTEPAEANLWSQRLRAAGYGRLDVISGQTPNEHRSRVIQRWRADDTDIIVATSAFGLGVDKADVRAVVHATLPENVDRFYQEVGRGGRDGGASLSLVVYTPRDIERAKRLNTKKIIGIERGQERWTRMFDGRADLGAERCRIPIDVQPSRRPGDIEMENDLNRAWNIRTLTLMSRARLISLDAEAPPALSTAATDDLTPLTPAETRRRHEQALEDFNRRRVIRLRHHGTVSTTVWRRNVEPVRQKTYQSDVRSHQLMLEFLRGFRCVGDILSDAYSVSPRTDGYDRRGIAVAAACGGCEYCRANRRERFADPLPTPYPSWPVAARVGEVLNGLRTADGGIAVFYDELPVHRLIQFVRWVIAQGVRVAVMPQVSLVELQSSLYEQGGSGEPVFTYALEGFRFIQSPPLPSLTYLPQHQKLSAMIQQSVDSNDATHPLRILLVPNSTRDSIGGSHRLLRHVLHCTTLNFNELSIRAGL